MADSDRMGGAVSCYERERNRGRPSSATGVYEHPWAVRFCHWANAVTCS